MGHRKRNLFHMALTINHTLFFLTLNILVANYLLQPLEGYEIVLKD